MYFPKKYFSSFFHFLIPERCVSCGLELLSPEDCCCFYCCESLNEYHMDLGSDHDFTSDIINAPINVLFQFKKDNVIQVLLHGLKYRGNFHLAKFFANRMLQRFSVELKEIEGLVPIPIHPKKRFKRGYNQCDEIANSLSDRLNKPLLNSLIVKTVNNSSQTKKNKEERTKNVVNSFWVSPQIKQYTHLGIIEDVLTTGATIHSVFEEIKKVHPSLKISFFIVASAIEWRGST